MLTQRSGKHHFNIVTAWSIHHAFFGGMSGRIRILFQHEEFGITGEVTQLGWQDTRERSAFPVRTKAIQVILSNTSSWPGITLPECFLRGAPKEARRPMIPDSRENDGTITTNITHNIYSKFNTLMFWPISSYWADFSPSKPQQQQQIC